MNHKLDHLFTVSHCPSEEVLLDYVKGRLSAEKARIVEIHIADCPMCSDYVEGLSLMSDADNIHAVVEKLNAEIDKATGKKTKKFFFRYPYMSAAAAVLLILVSVTFLLQNQLKMTMTEDMVAQNDMESKNKDEASPMEESSELETETRSSESAKKAAPPIYGYLMDDVQQEKVVTHTTTGSGQSIDRTNYYADIVAADEDIENDYRSYSLVLEEEVAEVQQSTVSKTTVSNEVDKSKEASLPASTQLREEQPGKVDQNENTKEENANYWRQATTGGVKRKSNASNVPSHSALQEGVDLYDSAKYNASLQYFENVLKTQPNNHTAKWYYALNLIKLKRNTEAKVVLQSIVDGDSPYKNQAKEELKKLK